MSEESFKIVIDGKTQEFRVRSPNLNDNREAQKVYNTTFNDAVQSNAILRDKLNDFMKQQGLWDDAKEAELTSLQKEILEGERALAKGGIKLSQARQLAIEMRQKRVAQRELLSTRTSLDSNTAEGQADNARFNYLVSACLVYNDTGKPYFKDLADYLNSATKPVSIEAASRLASMMYGLDSNFEDTLPENKFLKSYGFVDEKLRLVDDRGRLVDLDGRLIDENGKFIDENGNFVDIDGNPLTKDGEYAFEQQPFLDDDGKPIEENKKVNRRKKTT